MALLAQPSEIASVPTVFTADVGPLVPLDRIVCSAILTPNRLPEMLCEPIVYAEVADVVSGPVRTLFLSLAVHGISLTQLGFSHLSLSLVSVALPQEGLLAHMRGNGMRTLSHAAKSSLSHFLLRLFGVRGPNPD